MAVGPGDMVKVTYHGRDVRQQDGTVKEDTETPFTFMWNGRGTTIKPGESGFVLFEAMANALGDPRSAGEMTSYRDESGLTGFILDRETEVRRLRVLYDNQMADSSQIHYAPKCDVETLDGEPIPTVTGDPSAEGAVAAVQPFAVSQDQLLAQIQRQQKVIERLAQDAGIDMSALGNAQVATTAPQDLPGEVVTPDLPHDPTTELPEDK